MVFELALLLEDDGGLVFGELAVDLGVVGTHPLHVRYHVAGGFEDEAEPSALAAVVERTADHRDTGRVRDPVEAALPAVAVLAGAGGGHRHDEAIRNYRKAVRSEPDYADAYYNLARLLEQTGDRRSALRYLKTYRKLTNDC